MKKNIISFSLVIIICFFGFATSIAQALVSAGILPYTCRHGEIYFLIGQEPNGMWADFGGRAEATDKTPRFTAAREFSEETRYVFGKFAKKRYSLKSGRNKKYLRASINYILPKATCEITHPKGYYKMYLAHVDYIPAHIFNNADKVPHYEKQKYRWVLAKPFLKSMKLATNRYKAYYDGMQIRRQIYDILHNNYDFIMKTLCLTP